MTKFCQLKLRNLREGKVGDFFYFIFLVIRKGRGLGDKYRMPRKLGKTKTPKIKERKRKAKELLGLRSVSIFPQLTRFSVKKKFKNPSALKLSLSFLFSVFFRPCLEQIVDCQGLDFVHCRYQYCFSCCPDKEKRGKK